MHVQYLSVLVACHIYVTVYAGFFSGLSLPKLCGISKCMGMMLKAVCFLFTQNSTFGWFMHAQ